MWQEYRSDPFWMHVRFADRREATDWTLISTVNQYQWQAWVRRDAAIKRHREISEPRPSEKFPWTQQMRPFMKPINYHRTCHVSFYVLPLESSSSSFPSVSRLVKFNSTTYRKLYSRTFVTSFPPWQKYISSARKNSSWKNFSYEKKNWKWFSSRECKTSVQKHSQSFTPLEVKNNTRL